MLKPQLLDVCKRNKPQPTFVLDELLKTHGHDVLRLPQYHAELNAIELIWANIKGKIAANNLSFKFKDVMKLTQDAIASVTVEDWARCCRHVVDVEHRFRKSSLAMERAIESFIVEVR